MNSLVNTHRFFFFFFFGYRGHVWLAVWWDGMLVGVEGGDNLGPLIFVQRDGHVEMRFRFPVGNVRWRVFIGSC